MTDHSSDREAAPPGRPYLNTAQAGHRLGISIRKLEQLRKQGTGPRFRRHGRLVFYHIDDLETWSRGTADAASGGSGNS